MKLLAVLGSAALAIYIIVVIALTFHSVSRHVFSLRDDEETETMAELMARQTTIILWPLVAISSEGREFLRTIWKGNT